jgi:hypothetical protein
VAVEDGAMSGVSNTTLSKKIDELTESVHKYQMTQEQRLTYLETCMPEVKKKIEKLDGKVDTIQKRGYILDGVTGVVAAVGTILGLQK